MRARGYFFFYILKRFVVQYEFLFIYDYADNKENDGNYTHTTAKLDFFILSDGIQQFVYVGEHISVCISGVADD